jgi:glycosyltransferase involved in cell wall biosynthesis
MSSAKNTTGVDRYIKTLIRGLNSIKNIKIFWINLSEDNSKLFVHEEEEDGCMKISIPLPFQSDEIIRHRFWIRKYNEYIFSLTRRFFEGKSHIILHIHTINLIDLALFIREQVPCKIITHLHCIPWKEYYNTRMPYFNLLYDQVYIKKCAVDTSHFITNNCELDSYKLSDHVVCVTGCAREFLTSYIQKKDHEVTVIPNGMDDFRIPGVKDKTNSPLKLIYVGVLTKSKGLWYILDALNIVKERGFDVSLVIAGRSYADDREKILKKYKDLSLEFLGVVPFDVLKGYYQSCDIGVIASLQEQSSYVAIEMAMFGLPVITTAVDGLDEMFTDGIDALKVNTTFSKIFGLRVDIQMYADKIISLIQDEDLRIRLGKNARILYEEKMSLTRMIDQTKSVYQKIIN